MKNIILTATTVLLFCSLGMNYLILSGTIDYDFGNNENNQQQVTEYQDPYQVMANQLQN
jgi:hypothetical protein